MQYSTLEPKEENVLSKKFILERLSQEQIFERYLGIGQLTLTDKYCNPLRNDRNPTCSFKWIDGKLRFADWSGWMGDKTKDCFDIVQIKFNCDFNTACRIIARDFGLLNGIEVYDLPAIVHETVNIKYRGASIRTKRQDFTKIDKEYLASYGLTREICRKFYVFSVNCVWINNRVYYLQDRDSMYSDPALAWYLGRDVDGEQQWKIYFYKRRDNRFRCNTTALNGLRQLPESGPVLVITKSMKDVMVLSRFSVPAIAPQSESYLFSPDEIEPLLERFDRVFSFYDFDPTGIKYAQTLKYQYGITPLFLTNGKYNTANMGAKDISDYVERFGIDATERLIDIAMHDLDLYGICLNQ